MRNVHKEIFEKVKALIEKEISPSWADWNNDGCMVDEVQNDLYRQLADLFIELMPEDEDVVSKP